MRLLLPVLGWLLLTLSAFGQQQTRASDEGTSPTLVIGATDYLGLPVGGARFVVTTENAGKVTVATDENGQAVVSIPGFDEICHVVLEGEEQITSPTEVVSGPESRAVAFLVFSPKVSAMGSEERRAFAEHYGEFLEARASRRREKGDIESPSPVTPDRVLAFLGGWRREDESASSVSPSPDADGIVVSARLLDEFGRVVAGVPVSLHRYDETLQALVLAGYEETDASGIVLFEGCDSARLHRVEVSMSDGRVGSSPIFRPTAETGPLVLAPIILWPAEKRISGAIFDGDRPVKGAAVQIQSGSRVRLSTSTDDMGNFLLAPVVDFSGEVIIRQQNGHDGIVKSNCNTGMQEYLIPIDLLASTQGASAN